MEPKLMFVSGVLTALAVVAVVLFAQSFRYQRLIKGFAMLGGVTTSLGGLFALEHYGLWPALAYASMGVIITLGGVQLRSLLPTGR